MTGYARPTHVLSEREHQVLYWMSHGKSNSQIGDRLYLSEDTIKTHARRLFQKLGARDRAHAVRKGFEAGLLNGNAPAPVMPSPTRAVQDPNVAVRDALVALGWTPPLRVMSPERVS